MYLCVHTLFLLLRDVCEQVLGHRGQREFLVHADHQALRFGVDVPDVHTSFVMEKHMISLTCGVDTHVKLLLLRTKSRN